MVENGKKLSQRKLPETGEHLVSYFREHGSGKAADFFEDFRDYRVVSNGKISEMDAEEIPIADDVLNDIFRAVVTNDGYLAYTSANLEEVNPDNLTRLQTFIFKQVLDDIEEHVHGRYSHPTVYFDTGEKKMSVYMPPVVEKHETNFVLIDGIHRCYVAKKKHENIPVVVCEIHDGLGLPAIPLSELSHMRADKDILDEYIPTGEKDSSGRDKFFGLNPGEFRMYNYAGFGKFPRSAKSCQGSYQGSVENK